MDVEEYLIIEHDVDDVIPTDGAFGEEQWEGAHGLAHWKSEHLDEADYSVRKPRHLRIHSINFYSLIIQNFYS